MSMTGADQLWIYQKDYAVLAATLLAIWAACFQRVLTWRGAQRTMLDVRFQLVALSVAALVLLPCGVLLPGFRSGLDFVAERMSLAGAVLFCALIMSVRLPKPLVGGMAAIALVFFALSYRDERALNQLESKMERAVAQLPPGQRVVSALEDQDRRVRSLTHMIDRVCLGRCFSYANYEPCTRQFRVRAESENPIVVWSYRDSWDIQNSGYVVKPHDLPLYKVDLCDPAQGELCVSALDAGDRFRNTGLRMAKIQDQGEQAP